MSHDNAKISHLFGQKCGQIAVLIDPEKCNQYDQLKPIVEKAEFAQVDYIFVGGSTVSATEFESTMKVLRSMTTLPLVIFPGDHQQISNQADALLYLSLLSGRNADFLIGQHVAAAKEVFDLGIEVIPTAYILVDGLRQSSVAYVSQTSPIPRENASIALRTALAGVLQGKRMVFFDAGSGAKKIVPPNFISELKRFYPEVPVIVGGGIRTIEDIQCLSAAGANVIVIGNKVEEEIDFLLDIAHLIHSNA
jgi:putative glycerol-1-phosphate prenyltransferase